MIDRRYALRASARLATGDVWEALCTGLTKGQAESFRDAYMEQLPRFGCTEIAVSVIEPKKKGGD